MHVPPVERDLAMRRLRGLLSPGGTLVISTRSVEFAGNRSMYAVEADTALPGTDLDQDDPDLDEIFDALEWQVDRMRRDQQVEAWPGPS